MTYPNSFEEIIYPIPGESQSNAFKTIVNYYKTHLRARYIWAYSYIKEILKTSHCEIYIFSLFLNVNILIKLVHLHRKKRYGQK